MDTIQIEILNPKAAQLLQMLADLKLISIREAKDDSFLKTVQKIRTKAKKKPISLEEITNEVDLVRSERYARAKK